MNPQDHKREATHPGENPMIVIVEHLGTEVVVVHTRKVGEILASLHLWIIVLC